MKSVTTILLPLFLCLEGQAAWQATGYPGNQNWNKALLVQPQNWHQQYQPQNLGLQQQPKTLPKVTMILDLPTLLKAAKALEQNQEIIKEEKKPKVDLDQELEVHNLTTNFRVIS